MVVEALAALHARPRTVTPSSGVNGGTPMIRGTAAEIVFPELYTAATGSIGFEDSHRSGERGHPANCGFGRSTFVHASNR